MPGSSVALLLFVFYKLVMTTVVLLCILRKHLAMRYRRLKFSDLTMDLIQKYMVSVTYFVNQGMLSQNSAPEPLPHDIDLTFRRAFLLQHAQDGRIRPIGMK